MNNYSQLNKTRQWKIVSQLLYRAYAIDIGVFRKIILKIIQFLEGGEFYSTTMRRIYSSYHGVNIGMYSYGGCFSQENIRTGTEIGRYCSFATNVYIYTRNHPYKYKSTHPFFYNSKLKLIKKDLISTSRVIIGNDVWIGMNVIILPSVSYIGDGVVIGAGSIVTKDIPPFAVVAGNPARVIKYRFSDEIIMKIKESRWWDKNIHELSSSLIEFTEPLEVTGSEIHK
jgi:virginiamycin A acetyltransferase